MKEFRAKLNENGRIVLPAILRKQLHFKAGEELIIRVDDEELRIYSVKHSLKKAQELVRKYAKNKKLVQQLKAMRREDNE